MAWVGEAALLLAALVVAGFGVWYVVKVGNWLVDNHEAVAACLAFAGASFVWGWADPDPQGSPALPFVIGGLSLGAALFVFVFEMHQDRAWIRRDRDLLKERVAKLEDDRRADGI